MLAGRVALLLAAGWLSACVATYQDDAGARRVIGFADVEVRPADGVRTYAGDVISIRSLGLTVGTTPDGLMMGLGYLRGTSAWLRSCSVAQLAACGDGHHSRISYLESGGLILSRDLPAGGRGFLGLVDITLPAPAGDAPIGGRAVELEAYGLALLPTPLDSRLTFGASRVAAAALHDSVIVAGDPLDFSVVSRRAKPGSELSQRTLP